MKFKKSICFVMSLIFTITNLCIAPAFLSAKAVSTGNATNFAEQSDVAHGIYDFNHSNSSTSQKNSTMNTLASSSGLISAVQLTLTRDSSTQLNVYGDTTSDSVMSKIGFTSITIQREVNGTWTNYATWTDMYDYNALTHSEDKEISVQNGYFYRAIAYHYAEKPTFLWFTDNQTYYNQTTALYM